MAILNLDAGEHDAETPELWGLADVLCVACGGHAGDAISMKRLADFCAGAGRPKLGAHPSYPDRAGFGRRPFDIDSTALAASVSGQCALLGAFGRVEYVKLHGALYHDAARDQALAASVLAAISVTLGSITVIGPPHGALRDAAAQLGLSYLREGFADRRTRADGSLVPRGDPDALLTDPAECAARARALAHAVDTICVHGDTPNAIAIATAVRKALQ